MHTIRYGECVPAADWVIHKYNPVDAHPNIWWEVCIKTEQHDGNISEPFVVIPNINRPKYSESLIISFYAHLMLT